MVYSRNCPDCGRSIEYSSKGAMVRSIQNGSVCGRCAKMGEKHPAYGTHHTDEWKRNMSSKMKNRYFSHEHRERIRQSKLGSRNAVFGTTHTEEQKRKIRRSVARYVRFHRDGAYVNMGKNERMILDAEEQKCGRKIIRNYLVDGVGYIVDGYCPETNTVYEVYEKYHNRQVQKDLNRETEICHHLGCDFIIIWDK